MTSTLALVTGATGCLGRHLVARLARTSRHVRATGRNRQIGPLLTSDNVEFVAADLCDPNVMAKLVKGVETVFHCAALSAPWGPAAAFNMANVQATRALASAAVTAGCRRFIHVSSPSIYFAYRDALNITEDTPLPVRFANAYAASKAQAETALVPFADHGLEIVILRPRGIFGEYDSALAPRLMRFAQTGKMPLFRSGNALVDVTYAGNVAEVMCLAAAPDAPVGTFNITNDQPVTVRVLLNKTFKALGCDVKLVNKPYPVAMFAARLSEFSARLFSQSEPFLLRYTVGVMANSQTLNIDAAKQQLGYAPRVSIDEGLARYANWLNASAENDTDGMHTRELTS